MRASPPWPRLPPSTLMVARASDTPESGVSDRRSTLFAVHPIGERGRHMLEWILNPFGVSLGAYVILWIGLLISLIVGLVAGIITFFTRNKD